MRQLLNVVFVVVLLVVANLHQYYASTTRTKKTPTTSMQINANSTSSTNYSRNATTTATTTTAAANNNENHAKTGNYKLPTWFNFDAYKQFYGKSYKWRAQNELHKRIYLNTSVRVFEQRALFRARRLESLASVNELSDLTSEQLLAFKQTGPPTNGTTATTATTELPDCCSYDQVYARIIELLERATSVHDLELSGALVAELEQKPLVFDHIDLSDGREDEDDQQQHEDKATWAHLNGTKLESIGQSGRHHHDGRLAEPLKRHREPTTIKPSDGRKLRREKARPVKAPPPTGVAADHEGGVPADLAEAVRRQVAQQLSSKTEFGRQLNRQLSEYFGQPVEIRTRPAAS